MTLDEFIALLPGKARKRGSAYGCQCPAHPDRVHSLSVKEAGGKILLKCFAGCTAEDITRSVGLEMSDLFSDEARKRDRIETYYVDKTWTPVIRKVRKQLSDGKTFVFQGYNKDKGAFDQDASSVKAQLRGLLYRLPQVLDAVRAGQMIHLVNGEKAADRLFAEGVMATCQPYGEGPGKFTSEHALHLKGADVCIWADKDAIGEKYAAEVATVVRPFANSVRIVQSATEGDKDDAYDHLEAGLGIADAVDRSDLLPPFGLEMRDVTSFAEEKTTYVWEPYIPEGKITLIDAKESTGKTSVLIGIAAGLSRGILPMERVATVEPVVTLYFGQEDTPGEIHTVYKACGGVEGYFYVLTDPFTLDDKGIQNLRDTIKKYANGNKVVAVFDPLIHFCTGIVRDINNAAEVVKVTQPLQKVAISTGAAILLVRHTLKVEGKRDASALGVGSYQLRASARSQLIIRPHPKQRQYYGQIVVTMGRGSLLTRIGPPFAYVRNGNAIEWVGYLQDDPFRLKEDPKALAEELSEYVQTLENRVVLLEQSVYTQPAQLDLVA